MAAISVLIVDDEVVTRKMIAAALAMGGYHYLEAVNAKEALELVTTGKPDLMLISWPLPDASNGGLTRGLKEAIVAHQIPAVLLTALPEKHIYEDALSFNTTDYIAKPFSPRDLTDRLKAALERVQETRMETPIEIDGLRLDPITCRVTANGRVLSVDPVEYKLLKFFMAHQERAYTNRQLIEAVWGGICKEQTVVVYIRRLRNSLGQSHRYLLQTVRGTGYRFSRLARTCAK